MALVIFVLLMSYSGYSYSGHYHYGGHYGYGYGGGDVLAAGLAGLIIGGCVATMAAEKTSFGRLTKDTQDDLWRQYQEKRPESEVTWAEFLNRLNLRP